MFVVKFLTLVVTSWMLYISFVIRINGVLARVGDLCTSNDTTNCTGSGFTCSDAGICGCARGYLVDSDNVSCRLPNYNESCDMSVGCHSSMMYCQNVAGSIICRCEISSYFYDDKIDLCVKKPDMDEYCYPYIGCLGLYQCVGQPPTCQCNSSDVYFDTTMYQCVPLSDTSVNVLSTDVSTTTVTFNWTPKNPYFFAVYDIEQSPHDGKLEYVNAEEGLVSGLHPGTEYNFTIVSKVTADVYNEEKKYYGPALTVWTIVPYGGLCYPDTICEDSGNSVCMEALDKFNRCLCRDNFYNKSQTGECSPLSELIVSNISSRSMDTQVIFTWIPGTDQSSVTYRIQWVPTGGGHVDKIYNTGAEVSGLTGNTKYVFSITSVVPADEYNDEKNITVPNYSLTTDIPYLGACSPNTSSQCLDLTACIYANVGRYLCLCNSTSFYMDRFSTCFDLSELSVTLYTATAFPTTVFFSWVESVPGLRYDIEWSPPGGTLNYTNEEGGQVFGLQPGVHYNFTIVSVLSADQYYPQKKYYGPKMTAWTESRYGEVCDPNAGCFYGTACMDSRDNQTRCLCNYDFFNTTQYGNCVAVYELGVTNIKSISSDTAVSLTWTPSKYNSSLTYRVQWLPKGGHVDRVWGTGAQVSGLSPGTSYYFSITSVLPADKYNEERSTSVTEYLVQTDNPQTGTCTPSTSEQCLDGTVCILANDNKFRCLCSSTSYFNQNSGNCQDLQDLAVSWWSATSFATTIIFTWVQSMPGTKFDIVWSPPDGTLNYTNATGGQLFGLQPGAHYNFAIVSILPADKYNPQKKYYGPNMTISTESQYGEVCNEVEGCFYDTVCKESRGDQLRCLCSDGFFNTTKSGGCIIVDVLDVTNINSTSSDTAVNLTWTQHTYNYTLTYRVQWLPKGGHVDKIWDTGAQVSGLLPGTTYHFTVTSILPADTYEDERSSSAPEYLVQTDNPQTSICTPSTSEQCLDGTVCILANDNKFRCLCSSTSYFNQISRNCENLSDLAVSYLTAWSFGTTITFSWVETMPGVKYDIEWFPANGALNYTNEKGGQVVNLEPGVQYNFTIVSILPADQYYPQKKYNAPNMTVWTESNYGEVCNQINECYGGSQCITAIDNQTRCLCSDDFFNRSKTGDCTKTFVLVVTNIESNSSDTAVNFTWTPSTYITPGSLSYRIQWMPTGGHVDQVFSTGAQISGLAPGTTYHFLITSVLSADKYNFEKTATAADYIVNTEPHYGEVCNQTDECYGRSECITAIDNQTRCLCSDGFFNRSKTGDCTSTFVLVVTNIESNSSDTAVNFTWTPSTYITPGSLSYRIQWMPTGGHVDQVFSMGAQISGLAPGTTYHFLITSILAADKYNFEKTATAADYIVKTEPHYGEVCNQIDECYGRSECITAIDNQTRCLCSDGFFNRSKTGDCTSTDVLVVTDIESNSSDTAVNFTWTPSTYLTPGSLNYRIQWMPTGGHVDQVFSTGAQISGLAPGTTYHFLITSVLSADKYNFEKTANATDYIVKTDIPHTGICTPNINDQCLDGTVCILATDNKFRCLCSSTSYFNQGYLKCFNLSDLEVSATAVASATVVKFYWAANDIYAIGGYEIDWSPHDGFLDYIIIEGGQVSGLHPGTQYNFTVVSMLTGYQYYSTREYIGPNITVWTEAVHGVQCSTLAVCQDNTTTCMPALDKLNRCLCGDTQYNKTQTGNCSSLEDLKVSNVTATTSANSVTITWTADQHNSSVIYNITWTPTGGQIDNINNIGAHVTGLTSGTTYNFTITSILPSNIYYQEKSISIELLSITTTQASDRSASTVGLRVGVGCAAAIVAVALGVIAYMKRGPISARLQGCRERGSSPDAPSEESGDDDNLTTADESRALATDNPATEENNGVDENISLEDLSENASQS